jgi:hypothetical protein
MPRPLPRLLLLAVLCCLGSFLFAPAAQAKLSGKEWKEAETLFKEIFAERGNPKGKQAVLETILSDGTSRAWRTISQALILEVQMWSQIHTEYVEAANEHGSILQRSIKGYTAEDENRAKKLQDQLRLLEQDAVLEHEALELVVAAINQGPEALRKTILQRAKGGDEWPYRAAAIRVAVASMGEDGSRAFLMKALGGDKDPRVRLAGLDALASAESDWEGLVLGRLADPDWGVVLRATAILADRDAKNAVPHLINALPRSSPRVAEGIGAALRKLTGENFEAYADVWGKWWEDHKEEFKQDVALKSGKQPEFADVTFYGVPLKSDKVLFIIDISGSMKLETKNDNPMDRWKPPPTVTGGDKRPPPPPPPEEILSGPKINVAKHELKKAIDALPEHWTFNIVAFNQGAISWRKGMTKAKKKEKEEALKWVRALAPHGSTYTDAALRMGFEIAGLINFDDKYPNIELDTIVLLSDGAPTDNSYPTAKIMDFNVILEHVREWNKRKQVVIHCIAVDMQPGNEFMSKLAEENGGTFVDR